MQNLAAQAWESLNQISISNPVSLIRFERYINDVFGWMPLRERTLEAYVSLAYAIIAISYFLLFSDP